MQDGKAVLVAGGIPKPCQIKQRKPAIKIYRDGREVCNDSREGIAEYKRRRDVMWNRDKGVCCLCLRFCRKEDATFEHLDGRGMGGSRRDDRIAQNGIAHFHCNSLKGSKRI